MGGASSFLYEEKRRKKARNEYFGKIDSGIFERSKILNGVANNLIGVFVDYRCDVELFGEETRRLCLIVVDDALSPM